VALREIGREGDIEESALPVRIDGRHAAKRRGQRAVFRDDAQATRPLGDEHAPVGQEREAPRILEIVGERNDAEAMLLRVVGSWGRRTLSTGRVREQIDERQHDDAFQNAMRGHSTTLTAGGEIRTPRLWRT